MFNRFLNMSSIPKYARASPLIVALGPVAIPAFQAAKTTAPIDPQKVQDQQDMTWADYHPIPGVELGRPVADAFQEAIQGRIDRRGFRDQPFVVTLPKHSDLFGNPQIDPIPREQVPQFYADFYNTPSAINHGQTINGYWMEQSRGQIGIGKIDAFGPVPHAEEAVSIRAQRIRPEGRRSYAATRPMAAWSPMPTRCGARRPATSNRSTTS